MSNQKRQRLTMTSKQKTTMTSKQGASTEGSGGKSEKQVADPDVKKLDAPIVKKMKYPPADKSDKILEKLHMRRVDGEFCDVQLKLSKSKTVHAHKSILATCSLYFEGMFTSSFMEATSDVIDLSHITDREDVLEKVIDTFYGRTFEISEENVSDTINLATMLLLEDLKSECAKVLYGLAHVRNAAEMLQISINFDLKDLKQKVLPMVTSRFHDYILFQDDLFDLSVEGFQHLILNIDTSFIANRAKYIQFILRWFLICESEERAKLLKKAIKKIKFKVTKRAYREFEDQLEDVMNHLDDANSDVSDEIKQKISKILPTLKPDDYIKNPSPETVQSHDGNVINKEGIKKQEDSDSEFEDEPKRELYNTFGARLTAIGPPTKKKGFTKEEEANWVKAHAEMADRDQHRIWAAQWPMDLLNKLGTHDDPNRPKKIKRESPPEIYKSRNRRVKSKEELAEEANLVEAIIVIAPSNAYLKRMEAKDTQATDYIEDMLDVCAYVPSKRTWLKVTSIGTKSMTKRFNQSGMSKERGSLRHRSRPDDSDDDDDDDDAIQLSAMMDMYGPDMPEMVMMMRGMPSSRRRRFMEEAVRGRMPPSMLRRMMEMDMDEDDFHRHEYMMMREMSRMHRRHRGPFGMDMMHMMRPREVNIPPLTDPKWNAVYLKHRLYFCHHDLRDMLFCYDIMNQNWYKYSINYTSSKQEHGLRDVKDGIELIVMGQVLHAVLRIAVFDSRYDHHYKSKEDKIEEGKRQEVIVKHAVYKMVGELGDAKWEKVMENEGHHEYIPIDKELRVDPDKERHGHPFMDYYDVGPMLRQPEGLKTILYAEDEEKLFVGCAVRKRYYKDESVVGYSITHIDTMYLDLKQTEHLLSSTDRHLFLRTLTPLYSDDLVAFLNDDLKNEVTLDLGKPGVWSRIWDLGRGEPEKSSEYLEGRNKYPRCPSFLFSARDGKSLWILRGKDDDTGETLEVYVTMFYQTRNSRYTTKHHPPPPFKCFTMAMAGKMNKTVVRTLGSPTKYLHSD